jgi:kinesin family protein 2/24
MKARAPPVSSKSPNVEAGGGSKKSCLSEIQRLQRVSQLEIRDICNINDFDFCFQERDERRKAMEEAKKERAAEEQRFREAGTPGDVDFQRMIRNYREKECPPMQQHITSGDDKICICIRKRPISSKEIKRHDYDSVTCTNPVVIVHDCKFKVDGISKYLESTPFEFDHTFHEDETNDDIYVSAVQPLVDFALNGGRATVFAYGQTGSGKNSGQFLYY